MEFGEEHLSNPLPWSVTNEVSYLVVDGRMKEVIPVLREKSEKRRAADPRFSAYLKLLDRIAEINKLKEIPLSLEKRRELSRMEKEMSDLQKRFVPDDDDGEEVKEGNDSTRNLSQDLVLEESLKILIDLASLQKESPSIVSQPVNPPRKTITDILDEWLRGVL